MLLSIGYICNMRRSAGKTQELAEHEVRRSCCKFAPAICGNNPEKDDSVWESKNLLLLTQEQPP